RSRLAITVTSSSTGASGRQSAGVTGAARTIRSAPRARATSHAAIALAPVAIPSSTTTTTLPRRSTGARPPRYIAVRRSSSLRSRASIAAICSSLTRKARTARSFITRTPSPIAPRANSSRPGAPSLRTTSTSNGAPSTSATSRATGTPPRARPTTTGACAARWASSRPSCAPASLRSRNIPTPKTVQASSQDTLTWETGTGKNRAIGRGTMSHEAQQRTHTAAIGLTFEEWNAWRGAAREAGYEHTSEWVREAVAAAMTDPKRALARELANIGGHAGALTDALTSQPGSEMQRAALAGTDRAAGELAELAQAVIDRW